VLQADNERMLWELAHRRRAEEIARRVEVVLYVRRLG